MARDTQRKLLRMNNNSITLKERFMNCTPLFAVNTEGALHGGVITWLWVDQDGDLFLADDSYSCADDMEFWYSEGSYKLKTKPAWGSNVTYVSYRDLPQLISEGISLNNIFHGYEQSNIERYAKMKRNNWKEFI